MFCLDPAVKPRDDSA
ncbi:MAG TPA: hypothetical protein DIC51_01110 [Coxiellaceae bacterium]|nr:hypothetical protein [Coxiellaceae bacterium]